MSFKINPPIQLDRKLCYDLWVAREGGQRLSIYQIPKELRSRGIINTNTGKSVTAQGVWRAACLYMLEHPHIAKTDTVSYYSQIGRIFSEEEFGKELLNKARQFLSKRKYRQWLLKYPEYKQYE